MDPIALVEKKHMKRRYSVPFRGGDLAVTVTRSAATVGRWIDANLPTSGDRRLLGIAVQWPQPRRSPAAALVLCFKRSCLLIQLSHLSRVPKRLIQLLRSQSTTFAGIWNGQHREKLLSHSRELHVRNLVDVRGVVGEDTNGEPLRNRSVEKIVQKGLGFNLRRDVAIVKSDWSAKYLRRRQVRQASVEAAACFQLAEKFGY